MRLTPRFAKYILAGALVLNAGACVNYELRVRHESERAKNETAGGLELIATNTPKTEHRQAPATTNENPGTPLLGLTTTGTIYATLYLLEKKYGMPKE